MKISAILILVLLFSCAQTSKKKVKGWQESRWLEEAPVGQMLDHEGTRKGKGQRSEQAQESEQHDGEMVAPAQQAGSSGLHRQLATAEYGGSIGAKVSGPSRATPGLLRPPSDPRRRPGTALQFKTRCCEWTAFLASTSWISSRF